MIRQLVFLQEVRGDISDAIAWYDGEQPGLGAELVAAIDRTLQSILQNPFAFPAIHKRVRRALTRRFPYEIFYLIESDAIAIIAIVHGSRDPRRWQDRLA